MEFASLKRVPWLFRIAIDSGAKVSDYLELSSGAVIWVQKFQRHLDDWEILDLATVGDDCRTWHLNPRGSFMAKTFLFLLGYPVPSLSANMVWRMPVFGKVGFFAG